MKRLHSKILLIIFCIYCLSTSNAFSQEYADTLKRTNELAVSAGCISGMGSIFGVVSGISDDIASRNDYTQTTKHTGTYGLDYYHHFNKWLRIGGKFVYEGFNTRVTNDSTGNVVQKSNISLFTLMPSVQFSYLNKRCVKLYSGIDIGATFSLQNIDGAFTNQNCIFAINLTLIGIRVGNERIFGLAEANFGYDAFIKAGVGLKF